MITDAARKSVAKARTPGAMGARSGPLWPREATTRWLQRRHQTLGRLVVAVAAVLAPGSTLRRRAALATALAVAVALAAAGVPPHDDRSSGVHTTLSAATHSPIDGGWIAGSTT